LFNVNDRSMSSRIRFNHYIKKAKEQRKLKEILNEKSKKKQNN
jgi:hypothetical protein